jgi:hypothetical protein
MEGGGGVLHMRLQWSWGHTFDCASGGGRILGQNSKTDLLRLSFRHIIENNVRE